MMARRVISVVIIALLGIASVAMASSVQRFNTDSLLRVLDGIVENDRHIEENLQHSIATCRSELRLAENDSVRFGVLGCMFHLYRKYRLDSALYYARLRADVARQMGKRDSISEALMNVADALKGVGRFQDGLAVLRGLPNDEYVKASNYYYYLLHSITLSLYNEYSDAEQDEYYRKLLRSYRDTILSLNEADASGYVINVAEIFRSEGKCGEALKILTDFGQENPDAVSGDAMYWCTLAETYKQLGGNVEAEKYCFAMAAIIDKRNSVKTYTSLQNLALLLNESGDTERAFNYITCAMEDITEGNARSRLLQVSQCIPIIADAYAQVQRQKRMTRIAFDLVVSVLVVTLVVIMVKLRHRNRRLTEMQSKLDAKNKELTVLNDDLKMANTRLGESNKIKEAYIAHLFKVCTEYIDDMEKFRMQLSRKLKGGQLAEIKAMILHPVANDALKDFFKKFDTIFLELFPTFIEDFNKLMLPGQEIVPKEKDSLNTELRIYALVRLGINDSTKIASFLHYSPQTVYNYRQKVRNRAAVPKEKFVEAVQNL